MTDSRKIFYLRPAPPIGRVSWAMLSIFMTALITTPLAGLKKYPYVVATLSIILLVIGATISRRIYLKNRLEVLKIVFYDDFFDAPKSIHSRTVISTRYESVLHVDVSNSHTRKLLVISTENHTLIYPAQHFVENGGEDHVVDFLRTQMSRGAGGTTAWNRAEERRGLEDFLANRSSIVTIFMCMILIAIFSLINLMNGNSSDIEIAVKYGANISFLVFDGELFRLIDANILHNDIVHLFGNVFSFFFFGRIVEKQLGRIRFIFLILLTGIVSQLSSSIWMHLGIFSGHTYSEGFSGVIFGVIGAFAVTSAIYKDKLPSTYRIKNTDLCYLLIVSFLLSPWIFPETDIGAHLGGFLSGIAITSAMCFRQESIFIAARPKPAFQVVLICLCLIWIMGIGDTARYNLYQHKWRADRDATVQYRKDLHHPSPASNGRNRMSGPGYHADLPQSDIHGAC